MVGGLRVILTDPSVDERQCLEHLEAAIDLMERTDRRWTRLVRRAIRHIVVWPGGYTAYDKMGGIHLSSSDLLAARPDILASALVHEATHLRIEKRGIRYDPATRGRIERLCVKQQAAFLRRVLPEGPVLAKQAEDGLGEPWWTEADRRARINELMEGAELPRWLGSLLFRLGS